jgi:hypothetical protein
MPWISGAECIFIGPERAWQFWRPRPLGVIAAWAISSRRRSSAIHGYIRVVMQEP